MSDVMLFGVLRMPYEMAMGNALSRRQFWQRAQEAADRLEAAEATPAEQPAPASTGREPMNAAGFFAEARRLGCKGFPDALEMAARDPVAAPELDVDAERRAMFQAFSVCLVHGSSMTPTEIADKLLAARSAAQGIQPESAQVSTEQAGDAPGEEN